MLSPTTTASGAAIGHVGPTSSLLHYLNPADDEHSLRQLLGPTSHGPLRSTTNELFEHRIILSLSHLPPLLSSLDKFMECSRGDVVMLPVVRMMANRLLPLSKRMLDSPSSEELCTLTTTLDINTSRDIKLDPSATAIELINACTGTMLRWETLGIVFAATALCVSRFSVTLSVPNQKGELLENLLTASHDCLLKGGHTFLSTWHMHQDLVARIWLQDTCSMYQRRRGSQLN